MNRDLIDYQKQYANHHYERYQVSFRKRKIKEILGRYNHQSLLEVGCGLESIFLDVDTYRHITVIEPAEDFHQKALSDKSQRPDKSITLIKSLLEDAEDELAQTKYDFILISGLLIEIPDVTKFLKVIYNVSSDDTVIHINTANAKSFHRLLAVEMGLIKSEYEKSESNIRLQQNTVYNLESLKSVVQKSGFETIEEGSFAFKPFTHEQMQRMIDQNLLTDAMLDGFYKMEKYLPELGSEIYVNIRKAR